MATGRVFGMARAVVVLVFVLVPQHVAALVPADLIAEPPDGFDPADEATGLPAGGGTLDQLPGIAAAGPLPAEAAQTTWVRVWTRARDGAVLSVTGHTAPSPAAAVEFVGGFAESVPAGRRATPVDLTPGAVAFATTNPDGSAYYSMAFAVGSNGWSVTCVAADEQAAEDCATQAATDQLAHGESFADEPAAAVTAPGARSSDDIFRWSRLAGQATGFAVLAILAVAVGRRLMRRDSDPLQR